MKRRQFYRFKIWWHKRLWHIVRAYPYRWLRLFSGLGLQHGRIYPAHKPIPIGQKIVDACFLYADILFIFDIYEFLTGFFKWNVRSLTPEEREMAKSVFGEHLDYDLVLLDERAYFATRSYNVAYVSANTINSWGGLSRTHLIHELVHVWQYQRFGAVYIPRALRAQFDEGYDYGGIEGLLRQPDFFKYNPEQQGDIITDYFRLMHKKRPLWGNANYLNISVYEQMVQKALTGK